MQAMERCQEAGKEKNTYSHPEVMTMRTTKTRGRSSDQTRRSTSIRQEDTTRKARPSAGAASIPGSKALKSVSDKSLLSRTRKLSERERETVLSILVHLIEIDRRRLYLPLGYSSLYALCLKELKYSESVAGRRIAVVRCIRRFPRAYRALASGKVNMTNLDRISGIMTDENEKELLRSIVGATNKQVDSLVGRHRPKSVIRDRVRPVYVRTEIRVAGAGSADDSKNDASKSLDGRAGVTPTGGSGKSPKLRKREGNKDVAEATESGSEAAAMTVLEEMFEIKFGASQEFIDKIAKMRSLLSTKYHRNIEFEELFSIVMDEYIERHSPEGRIRRKEKREQKKAAKSLKGEAKKVAETTKKPSDKPSKNSKSGIKEVSRYIPRRVRDEVHVRDKGRCTYVSPGGRRCGATADLQIDHIVPFARGGDNSPSNLRLLCGKHNRLEAERVYGKEKMESHAKKQIGLNRKSNGQLLREHNTSYKSAGSSVILGCYANRKNLSVPSFIAGSKDYSEASGSDACLCRYTPVAKSTAPTSSIEPLTRRSVLSRLPRRNLETLRQTDNDPVIIPTIARRRCFTLPRF